MGKVLELLRDVRQDIIDETLLFTDEKLDIIEKVLKGFEIIKNKRVDIICLLHAFRDENGCYFYNYHRDEFSYELMEVEYDLLKEVFNYE